MNEVIIALEAVYGEQLRLLCRWSFRFDCSVMVFEKLMALCDQLEQQLSQAEQSRRGLLEAVLREALVDSQADLALEGRA